MEWDEIHKAAGSPRVTPMPPICPNCGYNLTGAPRAVCPECGEPFSRKQLISEADRRWWEIRFQRHANQDATFGLILIAIGWLTRGADVLLHLANRSIPIVPTILVVILVAMGLMFGCRVFRLARLPEHAKEALVEKPNLACGVMALISGLALLGSLCVRF
jgi:hypothetical protein